MPARLYLRPQPRAFYLLTETHALVFRQPGNDETKASRSVVVAEFLPLDQVDTADLISVPNARAVEGVLGVTSVPSDRSSVPEIFLILLTVSSPMAPILPGSSMRPARVVSVDFLSLTSSFWDTPSGDPMLGGLDYDDENDSFAYQRQPHGTTTALSQAAMQGIEDPCLGMKKYIETGGFYHAKQCGWDISVRLGADGVRTWASKPGQGASPLETLDDHFVWNAALLAPFLKFRKNLPQRMREELDEQALLLPIIQGFVGTAPLAGYTSSSETAALSLISRLSCKRAGARFRTRGIDDDGNVANFVETESILCVQDICTSYVQVRGSVPLFWQQPQQGLGTLQQKVEITRPPQASQPAFDKHFMKLLDHYQSVHVINLLGQKDAEALLSSVYAEHFNQLRDSLPPRSTSKDAPGKDALEYTPYDFHSVVKLGGHEAVRSDFSTSSQINRSIDKFDYTAVDATSGVVIQHQEGVFRVNCLDCLDRTNFVQDVVSTLALRRFLASYGSPLLNSPSLWAAHRELWADNGDRLSKTYAGTGALNTSATRTGRKTFAGLLSDATKSVSRAYINNFQDKGKQRAIDMLLGLMAGQRPVILFDPVGDSVHNALVAQKLQYSTPRHLTLFCGTWNLNGRAPAEALNAWLFPSGQPTADIYSVAFQEIVELTPQQIVVTDPAKKRVWEGVLMDTFNSHFRQDEFLLMRSEQLVGTALMVVVRSSLLPAIRNIEYAKKKTGLQGLSGNKGGIGVRFDLYDASVCLMTCHLAAGQANFADRNADYRTISNGLAFLRGKTIDSHDIVVWGSDLNYRINLSNEEVRHYAVSDELDPLVAADQLALARDEGQVFVGYDEGAITFRPTYKYDNGTDDYDSSEKHRIPAWTDRVLYKGQGLSLLDYNCADLRTSDHRPVYAVFDLTVDDVDEEKKAALADSLVANARSKAGSKIDDRVESAAQGGVRSLVKEFTSVSLAPTPSTSPKPPAPPISRDHKPKPKTDKPPARLTRPPPLPPRSNSTHSVNSVNSGLSVPYEPRKRAPPPPVPSSSDFRKLGLPTSSAEITPVATGDFVLVPSPSRPPPSKPPPLPPRSAPAASSSTSDVPSFPPSKTDGARKAVPTIPPRPARPVAKKATVDMDSAPPAGLSEVALRPDRVPSLSSPSTSEPKTVSQPTSPKAEVSKKSPPAVAAKPPQLKAGSLRAAPAAPPKPSQLKGKPVIE